MNKERAYIVLNVQDKETRKIMVNKSYTVGKFMQRIRENNVINGKCAIFLLFKNMLNDECTLQPVSKTIGEICNEFGQTNTLYVYVKYENAFG